jgi:hypothetical protein
MVKLHPVSNLPMRRQACSLGWRSHAQISFEVVVLDRMRRELVIVRSSLRLAFDRSLQRAQRRRSARGGLSIIPARNKPDDA